MQMYGMGLSGESKRWKYEREKKEEGYESERESEREREREGERGRKSGFINLRFDFFAFAPKEIKSLPKPKMNIQTSGH